MIDLVYFQTDGFCNVMANQFKVRIPYPFDNIPLVTGIEVVKTEDIVALFH